MPLRPARAVRRGVIGAPSPAPQQSLEPQP